MKHFLLLIFIIGTAFSANEPWSIVDGKLYYKSLYVESDQDFTFDPENPEVRPFFQAIENPSAGIDWLKITSKNGHSEFWVYRYRAGKKLEKLDSYLMNFKMRQLSDDFILIERSRMGLSLAYIYQLLEDGTIKRSNRISDLILFDPSISLVVQLQTEADFSNKVLLSSLFSEKITYLNTSYSPTYMSDRLINIEANINGCILNLEYKKNSKDSLYESFPIPDYLCFKKSLLKS